MRYAVLQNSICVGISELSGQVSDPNLIPIAYNENPLGQTWNGSEWEETPPGQDLGLSFPTDSFIDLFGSKQMAIIYAATSGHATYDPDVAGLWNRLIASPSINTIHPITVSGLALLEAKGFITNADAEAILSGNAIV